MFLSKQDYANRAEKMKGFYFLPLKEMFARELQYWRKECKIPNTESWEEIAKQKLKDINF